MNEKLIIQNEKLGNRKLILGGYEFDTDATGCIEVDKDFGERIILVCPNFHIVKTENVPTHTETHTESAVTESELEENVTEEITDDETSSQITPELENEKPNEEAQEETKEPVDEFLVNDSNDTIQEGVPEIPDEIISLVSNGVSKFKKMFKDGNYNIDLVIKAEKANKNRESLLKWLSNKK